MVSLGRCSLIGRNIRCGIRRRSTIESSSDEALLALFDRYECIVRQHRWPRRLIVVRHGLSEGNVRPAVYGEKPDAHIALVEQGWEQARQAGRRIRAIVGDDEAVQFITSSYRRTRETLDGILIGGGFRQVTQGASGDSNHIGSSGLVNKLSIGPILEEHRLREQEFGMFQDAQQLEEEMKERRAIGSFYYRFGGGESGADVYDRVSHFVDSLRRPGGLFYQRDWRSFLSSKTTAKAGDQHDGGFRAADDWRPSTVVFVTHGLTARLFLMAWFNLTVDEFHGIWNLGNCEFYVLERDEPREFDENSDDEEKERELEPTAFKMLHPIKAGGKYPPPPSRYFKNGVSSTEPSTWGISVGELVDIWLRHSTDGEKVSAARQARASALRREILGGGGVHASANDEHRESHGPEATVAAMESELRLRLKLELIADTDVLPSEEASFAFLRDIVNLAYQRLVAAGYMSGREDTSTWPKKLWQLYLYDKRKQVCPILYLP